MLAGNVQAIVAGGSAGAIEALTSILPALPADFSIPIVITLHVHPSKPSHLAQVLGMHSALVVKEAEDKEPLMPCTVYLAPPNYHLLLEAQLYFSLSVDDPVLYSRPSIDVLFDSAADALGSTLLGLLLTGASEDGARGLRRIQRAGGLTVVQAPNTAAVSIMPEAALRLFSPDYVLPLHEIGPFLARLDQCRSPQREKK